jgi:hypothetical protein
MWIGISAFNMTIKVTMQRMTLKYYFSQLHIITFAVFVGTRKHDHHRHKLQSYINKWASTRSSSSIRHLQPFMSFSRLILEIP